MGRSPEEVPRTGRVTAGLRTGRVTAGLRTGRVPAGCRTGRVTTYGELAAQVTAGPPSCGPVRVVAVDGRAGAGKSTYAGRLAAALGAGPVVHTDDLLAGWDDTVGYFDRLREHVLEPLRGGRPGRYRRFDWHAGRFDGSVEVPVAPAVVVEGVASAAACEGAAALTVWVEAPRALRLSRGLARDGESLLPEWRAWMEREDAHAASPTAARADVVVDGDPSLPHDPEREFVRLA